MYALNVSQEDSPKNSHTLYRIPFQKYLPTNGTNSKKNYALIYIVIFKVTHYIHGEISLKTANALESLWNYL